MKLYVVGVCSFALGVVLAVALPAWAQSVPVVAACPPCPPCLSAEAQKAVDDALKALDAAKK